MRLYALDRGRHKVTSTHLLPSLADFCISVRSVSSQGPKAQGLQGDVPCMSEVTADQGTGHTDFITKQLQAGKHGTAARNEMQPKSHSSRVVGSLTWTRAVTSLPSPRHEQDPKPGPHWPMCPTSMGFPCLGKCRNRLFAPLPLARGFLQLRAVRVVKVRMECEDI